MCVGASECGKNSKSLVIQFLVGANSELSRIGCNKKKYVRNRANINCVSHLVCL